jgi:hypothetical protein
MGEWSVEVEFGVAAEFFCVGRNAISRVVGGGGRGEYS